MLTAVGLFTLEGARNRMTQQVRPAPCAAGRLCVSLTRRENGAAGASPIPRLESSYGGGAHDRDCGVDYVRTSGTRGNPRLGGQFLSIAFYERNWSGRRDSNPRPQPWQGCALPLSYARSGAVPGVSRRGEAGISRGFPGRQPLFLTKLHLAVSKCRRAWQRRVRAHIRAQDLGMGAAGGDLGYE